MDSTATALYWTTAWLIFAVFFAVSVLPLSSRVVSGGMSGRGWIAGVSYPLLMLAGLFLFRWPAFFVPRELNADESQFIAGALTLREDPVFWRSVDGQTAGPLIYYALVPLGPLGLLNYTGARLVGCLMIYGTLWFGYRGLRAMAGDALARLGILPAFCFFAFSVHPEFIHYSSEHCPLLLLAIGLGCFLKVMAQESAFSFWSPDWLAAGMALGAIPFAKLQAVPQAAALLLIAGTWGMTRRTCPLRHRSAALASLAAAAWLVPLAFGFMLTAAGAWESFWISYISDNLNYLDQSLTAPRTTITTLLPFLMASRPFCVLAIGSVLVIAVAGWRRPEIGVAARWPVVLLGAFALASVPFSLLTRRFPHYLLFLIMPLTLAAATAVGVTWLATPTNPVRAAAGRRWILAATLAFGVAAQIAVKVARGNPYLGELTGAAKGPGPVAREILRHTTSGDRLTVWGWRAEFHVETGLPQGTSNSNALSQLTPSSNQAYFLSRYLGELRKNQPRVFVDGVAPSTDFFDRSQFAHERFPDLRDYIAQNYEYLAEVDGARIYRRQSR